jgi:hypothetical protein
MPSGLLQALPVPELLQARAQEQRALLRREPVQARALLPSWSKQSEQQR